MKLCAIDPSVQTKRVGWAFHDTDTKEYFHGGSDRLNPRLWLPPYEADLLIIEVPRIYPAAQQKGDPNDIVDLAFAAGRLVESVPHKKLLTVYPRDWKGTLKKEYMTEHIEKRMEVLGIKPKNQTPPTSHDIDAYGMILWYQKTLLQKIYPR